MGDISATILGCLGPRLKSCERDFFAETQPWGFILFARNLENPDQTRRLTDCLRDAVGRDAPILIDQEGGRVQRLGPPHWQQHLPALDQVALAGENAARSMEIRAMLIAAEHRSLGIDVNCAPVADIAETCTHPVMKNRCYGTAPGQVTTNARSVAQGLLAGGALPVLKHLPGYGRAFVDGHLDLPVVDEDVETLRTWDFAPFKMLSDIKMGMTAHVVYTALDADLPATQSPMMIELIRKELGFDGLLMTDDISMEALAGTLTDRARASIDAGCDIVLHCNGELDEMQEIIGASGPLEGLAAVRAEAALAERVAPVEIDRAALETELEALIGRKL